MPKSKKPVDKKAKILKVAKKAGGAPASIAKVGGSHAKAFLEFIRTQGVVGLAIGLVLGGAVSVVVKSLVDNVVMPPLGFILGSASGLKGLSWTMGTTPTGTPAVLNYGIFLNDIINFIVIALVVYFIVRLLKVDRIDKKNS